MASELASIARQDRLRTRSLSRIRAALRDVPFTTAEAVLEEVRVLVECERLAGQAIAFERAERKLRAMHAEGGR